MYFSAVLTTQGGNVALNSSVWGLSSLAEKQMIIYIKNNSASHKPDFSQDSIYILRTNNQKLMIVLQILLHLFQINHIQHSGSLIYMTAQITLVCIF